MANRAVIAFATAELEGDDLVVLELIDDFGCDLSTIDKRGSDLDFAAIGDKKNFGKLNVRADLCVELLDFDLVAGFHAVLFAAGLDDCVCHRKTFV